MDVQPELASGEVKHLQRCINDLVSLLALPAIWSGGDPSQVLHTLLDALMRMLRLDLIYARLNDHALLSHGSTCCNLNRSAKCSSVG
jgi:hypothetical protein